TGATILAQRNRPGVYPGSATVNYGLSATYSNTACLFLDRDDIDGDDLCAYTNGQNKEWFDQQGTQLEFSWDISSSVQFKYLFGYNVLMYERNTDDDNVASLIDDRQFYVNHEAEYVSHELQLFWGVGQNLTFTSGFFFYDSVIDQRYDFDSSTGQENVTDPAYALDNILATVAPGLVPGNPALTYLFATDPDHPTVDIESAKQIARRDNKPMGEFITVTGPWLGDATLGTVQNGLGNTLGSDLHSSNMTEREAYAVYTQGVWEINDRTTLTFGVRYAEDDVYGEEQLAQFAESGALWTEPGSPFYGALNLLVANVLRGAISPTTLQPTGLVTPWLGGVPITFGAFREVERVDDEVTYRVNLDYDVTGDVMVYGNITTGYRSGGFNLAFFSQTPQYEPEELIAYEAGLKGTFNDGAVQLNAAVYLYDYESIHTSTQEACPVVEPPGGYQSACEVVETTASVQAAPGAEVMGFEVEGIWLVTDALTFGGNFSYTKSEYTDSFVVVDGADPTVPSSIYDAANEADRGRDIKGNQLLQVPETKASAWASYRFNLASGTLDLLGNYSYIDEVYFSAFESALDRAPSYARLDLRVTWRSSDNVWTVTGFVNNVMDEIGIRQILRGGAAEGYRRTAQVTEPRLYGIELKYDLGG
ncbi:MAG: TonB-dependent receptor, partial [Pseudomonadales bacterium]|nr:TonB-dependent receptor [Pseudomonadales bacterium]